MSSNRSRRKCSRFYLICGIVNYVVVAIFLNTFCINFSMCDTRFYYISNQPCCLAAFQIVSRIIFPIRAADELCMVIKTTMEALGSRFESRKREYTIRGAYQARLKLVFPCCADKWRTDGAVNENQQSQSITLTWTSCSMLNFGKFN